MANSTETKDTTLQITRSFNAHPEKVFQAWVDPTVLKQWFAPSDEFATPLAEIDLRVGGSYRIQMVAPNGENHTVGGVYREIRPPEKLVFTWAWEAGGGCDGGDSAGPVETLVTVEFHQQGEGTEMILTHELFPNSESRDKHHEGWSGCVARLGKAV